MSRQRTLWGAIFGGSPPAERHSLSELYRLHALLLSYTVVNEYNKASVIETLRALAEILIWGDQHEPRVFEFFLEHNLLQHFKGILAVAAHRKGEVAVQLLQVRTREDILAEISLTPTPNINHSHLFKYI